MENMVMEFRSYLEAEGRSAYRAKLNAGTIRVFLAWLAQRGLDPRTLGREDMETRFREVRPGEPDRARKCALYAFWAFLHGTHSGARLLPVLPGVFVPLVDALKSGIASRGLGTATREDLLRGFSQFCRYLALCGRGPSELCWEDLSRFGAFLSSSYLYRGRPLADGERKVAHAGRCLEMLRRDGHLPHLAPRQVYEPTVAHKVLPAVGHSWRVLLAAYREYLETIGLSASCVRSYPRMACKFLAWLEAMGVSDIRNVDERMLLAYRGGPGRQTREGAEASPSTRIANEHRLRSFFLFLYRTRRIHADPAAHMEFTPAPRRLPRTMLDVHEADSVLSAIDARTPEGARDLAVLELLYGTGLRNAEVRGLSLADVQLDGRVLLVHGKGRKDALVPFGDKVARALELYLAFARPCLARRCAGKDCGLVFLSEYGKRLTPNSLVNIVHRRVDAVGIGRNIVPHSLRHSCATHMLRNGADLRVVQQLLRHESINTTLVYTRMLTSDIREAQSRFHPREMD